MIDHPLSRTLSLASAGYAVFAGLKPRHLADALGETGAQATAYDRMARTYAARDIGISVLGAFGPARAVPVSIALRVLNDLGDAWALGTGRDDPAVRRKVLGVTLGYAALNSAALLTDRRLLTA